jgi:hypothetical protein
MGVLKYGTDRDGELVFADWAPKQFCVGFEPYNVSRFAARAYGAIRPAETFEQFAALFVGIKELNNVRESHSEYPN